MLKTIGIDLGLTSSCMSAIQNGEVIVVPNAEGARTTPSIVAFTKEGERLIGQAAKQQATTNPENTIFLAKRLLGKQFSEVEDFAKELPYKVFEGEDGSACIECQVGEKTEQFSPEQIISMLLQKFKEDAEAYLQDEVSEAVISVPAYFDDTQRQAIEAAGKTAGLTVKKVMDAPTAAAGAYDLQKAENELIVVYDMGAGTFTVSVLEAKDGTFQVKAIRNDLSLGGEQWNTVLMDHLISEFDKEYNVDLRSDQAAIRFLKAEVEKAKIILSSTATTTISVPFNDGEPKYLRLELTRTKLEEVFEDLYSRVTGLFEDCFKDAGCKVEDIKHLIPIGGMTRSPKIIGLVTMLVRKMPRINLDPNEVVAIGVLYEEKPDPDKPVRFIGIDLGVVNSCMAVMEDETVVVIPNSEGARTTPSVVAFNKEGECLVGQAAKKQAINNPQNTIFFAKRLIGKKYADVQEATKNLPYKVVEGENGMALIECQKGETTEQFAPEQIIAMLLKKLKKDAENYLGEEITAAIITVPSNFDYAQRDVIRKAAPTAGLKVKRIITEPTAAVCAYELNKAENELTVVCDMGGGTFTVSLVGSKGVDALELKAIRNSTNLGGDNWDKALTDYIVEEFLKEHNVNLRYDNLAMEYLKEEVEKAKIILSSTPTTTINVPFNAGELQHLSIELTRATLETVFEDLYKQMIALFLECVKSSNNTIHNINHVVLVGGMTRSPKIIELFTNLTGKPPHISVDPSETVAIGAVHAAKVRQYESYDVYDEKLSVFSLDELIDKMLDYVNACLNGEDVSKSVFARFNKDLIASGSGGDSVDDEDDDFGDDFDDDDFDDDFDDDLGGDDSGGDSMGADLDSFLADLDDED